MLNIDKSFSGFTQEDIIEIFQEEEREKTILEELRNVTEPYEKTLYVSTFEIELYSLPLEAQTEYCVMPRGKV